MVDQYLSEKFNTSFFNFKNTLIKIEKESNRMTVTEDSNRKKVTERIYVTWIFFAK